jgi:hypothetical protein
MTDMEFDILEELYFIQSYDALLKATRLQTNDLKKVLSQLLEKGWVRCYFPINMEIPFVPELFEVNFRKYYYIASKAGLLAHNGKEA